MYAMSFTVTSLSLTTRSLERGCQLIDERGSLQVQLNWEDARKKVTTDELVQRLFVAL